LHKQEKSSGLGGITHEIKKLKSFTQ